MSLITLDSATSITPPARHYRPLSPMTLPRESIDIPE